MTDAKHARGKTIVDVDGKLSKANWKSMDDEWPSEINRSNKPIALSVSYTHLTLPTILRV